MDKYKFQVAALALAVVIGLAIGAAYTGKNKNKEVLKLQEEHKKELERLNIESKKLIDLGNNKIEQLEEAAKQDSILIFKLEENIKQDGVRVEQRRRKAKSMTNEQKKKFLIDRYTTPK